MISPSARELWVLYDSACPFCVWCREWLARQPALIRLRFLCCRSTAARDLFGGLPLTDELVVVDEHGRWWAGPSAFAMTLWALESYRALAWFVSSEACWWAAREVFALIASQRPLLGRLVGVECSDGSCELPTTAYR